MRVRVGDLRAMICEAIAERDAIKIVGDAIGKIYGDPSVDYYAIRDAGNELDEMFGDDAITEKIIGTLEQLSRTRRIHGEAHPRENRITDAAMELAGRLMR